MNNPADFRKDHFETYMRQILANTSQCDFNTWCAAFKGLEKEPCHALGGLSNHHVVDICATLA